MTYSIDFRRKVLAVKERKKLSFEEAARRFDMGKADVLRWSGRLGRASRGFARRPSG